MALEGSLCLQRAGARFIAYLCLDIESYKCLFYHRGGHHLDCAYYQQHSTITTVFCTREKQGREEEQEYQE